MDINTGSLLICSLLSYLFGSIPTGYLIVKIITGQDIRQLGSKNIGATNVARAVGKKWAVFTAVFDMFKGGITILLAILYGLDSPIILALCGFCAVVGHDYPLWLKFSGGKGVATTYGVFAFYGFFNPIPAIFGGLVWFVIRELTGFVSVASIVSLAAAILPMIYFEFSRAYIVCSLCLVVLTIYRHRENIKRLRDGTENRVNRIILK